MRFIFTIALLFIASFTFAQEKTKPDTTLTLNLKAYDARLTELQGELKRQSETKEQATKVLQQSEDNIKALQSAIQAMMMVKQDTTLHVKPVKR